MTQRYQQEERWIQGKILVWMNEVIKEENLPFDGVEQEYKVVVTLKGKRYSDLIVWKDKKKNQIACVIELKRPIMDAYDDSLVSDALLKANALGSPFFATWNVNKLVLWETFAEGTSLLDRRLKNYDVTKIKYPSELEKKVNEIKSKIKQFLTDLAEFYEIKVVKKEKFAIPKLYPDEIMVYRLRSAVETIYIPMFDALKKKVKDNPGFLREIYDWFVKQGWIITGGDEDFEKVARQAAYLLINKILFYNVLRSRNPTLKPLSLEDVMHGEEAKEKLKIYFQSGVRMGYEVIFALDFLEKVPIPDEALPALRSLINELNKYDFSKIGYDIIGKIFEKLIPEDERHTLGQYFTRSDVVDLIIGFCIKNADDIVLDPACGSGTFLVRAYERKKYLAKRQGVAKDHESLLREIWGVDISKFPATLAMINLIIRDLEAEENIPKILCRDFFSLEPGRKEKLFEFSKDYKKMKKMEKHSESELPQFDAIVANPPYTRQEEMENIREKGYKERLKALMKEHLGINIGKRSSIYAYFLLYPYIFLKEGGRMGQITSNSWLDVDYGKYLQEFFLKHYKIVAIIESKVERWFEDADINTAIIILEKCSNEDERNENLVKFVQIKVPLRELIPEVHEDVSDEEKWREEEIRWKAIDELVNLIEGVNEFYEDDKIRIYVKRQIELLEEGLDEEGKYVGAKWGKYIRIPDIFFKILEKGKGLFVPLKEIADVRRGFTTGANEFFYLPKPGESNKFFRAVMDENTGDLVLLSKKSGEVMFRIEKEYWMHKVEGDVEELKKIYQFVYVDSDGSVWIPNYVVKSPQEVKKIVVEPRDLKNVVLMVHEDKERLKGKNVLKYIEWGESQGYHTRPTCKSRKFWYNVGECEPGDILWQRIHFTRFGVYFNIHKVFVDHNFFEILIKEKYKKFKWSIATLMNCMIYALFRELYGRVNLGQGSLKTEGIDIKKLPVIILEDKSVKVLNEIYATILNKEVESIFKELGANSPEEVSLDKVKPDRRELDKIVMGEILGLTEEEQLEVYRAVIDLVKSRIEKAQSVEKKKKEGVDVKEVAKNIVERIQKLNLIKKFPDDYIKTELFEEEIVVNKKGKVTLTSELTGFNVKVSEEVVYSTDDQLKAKFVYYSLLSGNKKIRIPADKELLKEVINKYEEDRRALKDYMEKLLEYWVPDKKIREEVKKEVVKRLNL